MFVITCDVTRADEDDERDDDYWEEEEDVFARQEATRERLETELGCDLFVKVYKAVQV